MCRELPHAEAGLMIALPFFQPSAHNVAEFPRIVRRRRLIRHDKMRLDHIPDILQNRRGALLDVLRGTQIHHLLSAGHGRPYVVRRNLALDLIAPDPGEPDGLHHIDPVYDPP